MESCNTELHETLGDVIETICLLFLNMFISVTYVKRIVEYDRRAATYCIDVM